MDHSQKKGKFGLSNPRFLTYQEQPNNAPENEEGEKVAWWLLKTGRVSDIPENARGEEIRQVIDGQDRRIAAVVVEKISKKIIGVAVEQGVGNAVLIKALESEYSDEFGELRVQIAR